MPKREIKVKDFLVKPFTVDASEPSRKVVEELGLDVVLEKFGAGGLLVEGKIPYYATYKSKDLTYDLSYLNYKKIKVGDGLIMFRMLNMQKCIYDVMKVVHKYGGVLFLRSGYDYKLFKVDVDEESGNLPSGFYAMRYVVPKYIKLMFDLPKNIVEIVEK